MQTCYKNISPHTDTICWGRMGGSKVLKRHALCPASSFGFQHICNTGHPQPKTSHVTLASEEMLQEDCDSWGRQDWENRTAPPGVEDGASRGSSCISMLDRVPGGDLGVSKSTLFLQAASGGRVAGGFLTSPASPPGSSQARSASSATATWAVVHQALDVGQSGWLV